MSTPDKGSNPPGLKKQFIYNTISICAPVLGLALGFFLPDAYESGGHPPPFVLQGPVVGLFLGSVLGTLSGAVGITSRRGGAFICMLLNLVLMLLSGSAALKFLPSILNKVLFLVSVPS